MTEEPRIEPAPILTPQIPAPDMVISDASRYQKAAETAQKLAQDNISYLNSLKKTEEQPMENFFTSIVERFSDKQTTITGIASVALPVICGALGISHPHILLIHAGFGVITAWLAKKDIASAAGLTGSFGAMALQTFGVPVPDILVSALNGFTGGIARDQKPSGISAIPILAFLLLACSGTVQAQNNSMLIPSRFNQNSVEILVIFDAAYCDSVHAYGTWNMRQKLIRLDNSPNQSRTALEQTFCHELIHCLLEHSDYPRLSRNERFVRRLSRALHEALVTMRYDDATLERENE